MLSESQKNELIADLMPVLESEVDFARGYPELVEKGAKLEMTASFTDDATLCVVIKVSAPEATWDEAYEGYRVEKDRKDWVEDTRRALQGAFESAGDRSACEEES